jgi:hypothetical protein
MNVLNKIWTTGWTAGSKNMQKVNLFCNITEEIYLTFKKHFTTAFLLIQAFTTTQFLPKSISSDSPLIKIQ